MDEKAISELINDLGSNTIDFGFIYSKLPQCRQALEWAKQIQRWDLVLEIASICTYDTEELNLLVWITEQQGKILGEEEKRNFCQQVQALAIEGLTAAKQEENQGKEHEFLTALSRLSLYVGDFDKALDYLKQELPFVSFRSKWVVGHEALLFGHKANAVGDYLAARAFYQMCLDITSQEAGNKRGVANVLDFMAINEEQAGNLSLAQELLERSQEIRRQLNNES